MPIYSVLFGSLREWLRLYKHSVTVGSLPGLQHEFIRVRARDYWGKKKMKVIRVAYRNAETGKVSEMKIPIAWGPNASKLFWPHEILGMEEIEIPFEPVAPPVVPVQERVVRSIVQDFVNRREKK